jgi:acyl carrier protein
MTVSSRTPEGLPHRCPVCDGVAEVEPSYPGGDSCCPTCGHLLWWFRDRLGNRAGVDPADVLLTSSFRELAADSLDMVELVMELEEQFGIRIPDDAAERMQTVEDVIRYILNARRKGLD